MMLTANQLKALKKMMPRDTKKNRIDNSRLFQVVVKDQKAYVTDSHKALAIKTTLEDQQILLNDHPEVVQGMNPPDINKLFDHSRDTHKIEIYVHLEELKRIADLSDMLKDRGNNALLKLSISEDGKVKTHAKRGKPTMKEPKHNDSLAVNNIITNNQTIDIWMNATYLKDICIAFNHLKSHRLFIGLKGAFNPIYFKDDKGNEALLSPVRII